MKEKYYISKCIKCQTEITYNGLRKYDYCEICQLNLFYHSMNLPKTTYDLLFEYKRNDQSIHEFILELFEAVYGPRSEYEKDEPRIRDVDFLIRKEGCGWNGGY